MNVTKLILEQIENLLHKQPNYTMVNYYSLKVCIQQINENYLYFMPMWLIIFIYSNKYPYKHYMYCNVLLL